MKEDIELQIIVDAEGIKCVRIAGSPELHVEAHNWYFKLQHLLPQLDKEIQKILRNKNLESH